MDSLDSTMQDDFTITILWRSTAFLLPQHGHNSSKSITTMQVHNQNLRLSEKKLDFGSHDFLFDTLVQDRLQISNYS